MPIRLRNHSTSTNHSSFCRPVEKSWTYKCESERCVRVGHHGKSAKRVSFISCSMTCGDINIWPHPTHKFVLSPHTHSFSVEDVQLQVDTSHREVRKQLQLAFDFFLKDLRQIQRLDYAGSSSEPTVSESSSKSRHHTDVEPAATLFGATFGARQAGDLTSVQAKDIL